jgi:hypothetical protein
MLKAAHTAEKIVDFRLRRGVKPQTVHAYDKAKQRCIRGGISGSKNSRLMRLRESNGSLNGSTGLRTVFPTR